MVVAMPGDVISFKKTLENAIAFDELLSKSKGQEKIKLFSLLKKIRHCPITEKSEA
jgi:hypothetical protein